MNNALSMKCIALSTSLCVMLLLAAQAAHAEEVNTNNVVTNEQPVDNTGNANALAP